eukprot:s1380_g4.t1
MLQMLQKLDLEEPTYWFSGFNGALQIHHFLSIQYIQKKLDVEEPTYWFSGFNGALQIHRFLPFHISRSMPYLPSGNVQDREAKMTTKAGDDQFPAVKSCRTISETLT